MESVVFTQTVCNEKNMYLVPNINYHLTSSKLMNQIQLASRVGHYPIDGHCKVFKVVVQKCWMVAKIVAFSVAFFIVRVGEYITYPINHLVLRHKISQQAKSDLQLLKSEEQQNLRSRVEAFIEEKQLNIPEKDRALAIEMAMASYATTRKYYGPVAYGWVKSLLDTALLEKRKVFFMARDTRVAYEMAEKVKSMDQRYSEVELSYVYLSRKVVNHSMENQEDPNLLIDYLRSKGLKEGEQYIFVDNGHDGSMIDPIREQLQTMNVNIEFEFLVSLTEKAKGYMSNMQTKLKSIEAPGQNPAVSWIEGAHQGEIKSPSYLVRNEKGCVHPNTVPNEGSPVTCKESMPVDYMLKLFAINGVKDYISSCYQDPWKEMIDEENYQLPWRNASDKLQKYFDSFLWLIYSGNRYIYCNEI